MSRGWKKRKISDSDSEVDISSSDESDDFLVSESGSEDETINNGNDLEDESCEESEVPLSTRQSNLRSDFKWTDQNVFNPVIYPFKDDNHGVQPSSGLTSRNSPVEIFKTIWDENLVDIICAQTNTFAESKKNNLIEQGKLKKNSRILKFSPVEIDEMYAFHALVILMGIIKKPELSMYWTTAPTLQTPAFKNCMTYDRFRLILSMLHFQSDFDDDNDALVKIRPVLEYLLERFQATYRPGENIAIDESLLLWKGRLSFKQFNRNKRARFGIKLYQTCESKTGYSYNIKVYIGKRGNDSYIDKRIGISGQVVKDMLLDLGGQGRTLYIDNWYSSPSLFYQLLNEKTNVCGTVRLNRRYLPKFNTKCIKKGDMKVFHTPKLCLMAWHDKKIVSMLTTKHAPELIDTGKKIQELENQ
ncbi:piggyBac transposable element-derived protein 4-like [Leptopilina heterotoma]|uniref:piggyBac transposable element-derived protein 4-like n=1 Tax=Leptopilina heterotoma TaxID=63436 RepID=UPI001CA81EE1|nr:piggyBac transposable element-derived protein 4-like [Leptopilina heterotoma]